MPTAKKILEDARARGVRIVDFKHTDWGGRLRHVSYSIDSLDSESLKRGVSAGAGCDDRWIPDLSTACPDPFPGVPTLSLLAQPEGKPGPRDVLQSVVRGLPGQLGGLQAVWGARIGFHLLDHVEFDSHPGSQRHHFESAEAGGFGGRGEIPGLGHKIRARQGRGVTAPMDTLQDFRSELLLTLRETGVPIRSHGHGTGASGQCWMELEETDPLTLADRLNWLKYVVKNTAHAHGRSATFLPMPFEGESGVGVDLSCSFKHVGTRGARAGAKKGNPIEGWCHGLERHAMSLRAWCNPLANSHSRLHALPDLGVSTLHDKGTDALVLVGPDASGNLYLSFLALALAGMDGLSPRPSSADRKWDLGFISLESTYQALKSDRMYLEVPGGMPVEWVDRRLEEISARVCRLASVPHPRELGEDYSC